MSTGVAGIGKSAELNAYLMEFLSNIGKSGWPREVWYRVDSKLFKFYLFNGNTVVEEEEKEATLSNLSSLTDKYSDSSIEVQPVLFLELTEDEINPISYISTLIQLSNHNVYDTTKEFEKAGATYMLVNPPTCADLCHMACFEARFGFNSVFAKKSKEEVTALVTERVNIVGPIPRLVFQNEDRFQASVADLSDNVSKIFDAIKRMSVTCSPEVASNYIAAFVDDESAVPFIAGGLRVPFSLRFLSDHIALLVARACTKEVKRQVLDRTE